ncbi:MAG TPA: S-adenosylmethionine:tRNA ribosyltransferase-isomerase [Ginsengibacter sp.]|nr:S-adenosylmethionine:tRNA ribosyltransferase-isomerase [Ginsengibacter sp.]HRP16705.1 S-adenosylmethionine:tRNA ribosyltransferase-isomerase [Ginsengibacter sp.]HRP44480.1 S-adenosylmethionine:tRNA ribosyltransferase-isomerase [Ginsengibacter sp.]
MHPKDLSIQDFTYELPNERIALYPAHPRDSSKLLIYDSGHISEDIYRHLESHLPSDAVLVFNDTRVIKSRILFPKSTGAIIEIFCLEPANRYTDYEQLFRQSVYSVWKCMIGKAGKWKEKQLTKKIHIAHEEVMLNAELIEKQPDAYLVRFSWAPERFTLGEVLQAAGNTPLPPYIKRSANAADEIDYQTVYSAHEGSVAAPTAGLHFSNSMMEGLRLKGIPTLFTTLHVGAGTFKPVKSETMEGHHMHAEWMHITTTFLEQLLTHTDKKIISVGTTATRTLESIFWMGNKLLNHPEISEAALKISQWEVYEKTKVHHPRNAITALLNRMKHNGETHLMIETEIIIAPGYPFQIVKGLITNFHQPKSTLLLLVAALAGDNWKKIYEYALSHNFRFLSYGDGSLILPQPPEAHSF